MTIQTTPFSGIRPDQITRALIAHARGIASKRGDTQIGFRLTKQSPYHTMCYTDPSRRGPSVGDSTDLREGPIDEGDWVVRGGSWTLVRG